MSKYYRAKRVKNLFDPESKKPFKISRSKIDLFLNCKRCFYLDRRLGVGRPPGFPFQLNSAVDHLLKKEFDEHRVKKSIHPLAENYGLNLIPFSHEKIDEWRENFKGVQFLHEETNFKVTGAVDDLWIDDSGVIFVVDYKATSKVGEVNINAEWQIGYKRQMEIYQWLMRKNGFEVSNTGYFVYCNGKTDRKAFDGKLEFDIKIIPYMGNDSWIEDVLLESHDCLMRGVLPKASRNCDYCAYIKAVKQSEQEDFVEYI